MTQGSESTESGLTIEFHTEIDDDGNVHVEYDLGEHTYWADASSIEVAAFLAALSMLYHNPDLINQLGEGDIELVEGDVSGVTTEN